MADYRLTQQMSRSYCDIFSITAWQSKFRCNQ